ncbi:MAG: hypothetical protein NTW94_05225 [Legionellales bacterium]|nr:hypothetical protein [Legionellales bacterium]
MKWIFLIIVSLLLTGCMSPPPRDLNNICNIFRQYPRWYDHALDVQRRWRVPIPVQMAIIHQESKFEAGAKPPRKKLMGFIPWTRPSTATGYSQALDGTWAHYKQTNGGPLSSRHDFADGVDFIGWYANLANRKAGISRSDAYNLYLAYHEGIGGYQNKTYLHKPWLIQVARKVSSRSQVYQAQLSTCSASLGSK